MKKQKFSEIYILCPVHPATEWQNRESCLVPWGALMLGWELCAPGWGWIQEKFA